MNFEFRFEILNAFNNTNFVPVGLGNNPNLNPNPNNPANANAYEVTNLTGTQTARLTQLVFRVNW